MPNPPTDPETFFTLPGLKVLFWKRDIAPFSGKTARRCLRGLFWFQAFHFILGALLRTVQGLAMDYGLASLILTWGRAPVPGMPGQRLLTFPLIATIIPLPVRGVAQAGSALQWG